MGKSDCTPILISVIILALHREELMMSPILNLWVCISETIPTLECRFVQYKP